VIYHTSVGSSRVTIRETGIVDGVVLPGSVFPLAPKPLHFNPQMYPDPIDFDPFRFAKLHTGELAASDVR
jgi:cytochrome P450